MAHILIMPRQGNTVESCIITDWKVKEGDAVTEQTVVCEVETDKASFEVLADAAGTVLKLLYESGDDVPVLKPIAVIGAPGEDWQAAISQDSSHRGTEAQRSDMNAGSESRDQVSETTAKIEVTAPTPNSSFLTPHSSFSVSPRAKNMAAREALPLPPSGTGPGGRIIERDILSAMENRPLLTAAAKAKGPGSNPPIGTGLGGRVTVADLAAGPSSVIHSFGEGSITETPIKGIRKIIAERMILSLAQSAQFTLNASAPASKLMNFRSAIKDQSKFAEEFGLSKVTINDLVLFAVSRILPRFPYMNAHKSTDIIKTFEMVHLGHAVDTPKGLMVPVIRNANLLTLAQISSEAKRLAASCQNGTAKADELTGSTFTVTNLGGLGISSFTPVLNTPEVAILGVCNIEMKPVALSTGECNCCSEPHIGFSLTIDHQAVDGAPAARFLKALGEAVAHIDLLLAGA